jgi:hypothetical protein
MSAVGGLRSFGEDLAAHRASTGAGCPQNGSRVRNLRTPPADRPRRPRRHRENGDYAAFLLRVIRAYGRRVAAGDPEDLGVMLACHAEMGEAIAKAVQAARAEQGWTWADVGRVAGGITRSSAHERWGGA